MAIRASGILLHPTSLPGPQGVGDLGAGAREFVDWLARAGQSLWQLLPLGPPGQGHSPYDALSSFAGNPLLISLDDLVAGGLLLPEEVHTARVAAGHRIDFHTAQGHQQRLLRRAWERSRQNGDAAIWSERIRRWSQATSQSDWLPDWTLFAALKEKTGQRAWMDWPDELRNRRPDALATAREELAEAVRFHEFVQFTFHRQLEALRGTARQRGIALLGDLPFYVAQDSCDVWTRPQLFDLDEHGQPRTVAGVPPDYFSATGQRWGNPIYRWDRHRAEGFQWWVERLSAQLRFVDRLRLDHFRAFAGYWEIPASESTAAGGRWQPGPGADLFRAVGERLGDLPFIAEDLGLITPDVEDLRQELNLPGMRVLQFAFDAPDSPHLPHNLDRQVVLYTGTHDNDTARGWIVGADEELRRRALDYVGGTIDAFAWELVRAAQTSVADLAVFPVQDLLGLGSEHRMNTPGTATGNWDWRLGPGLLTDELAARLRRMTRVSGRLAEPAGEPPH